MKNRLLLGVSLLVMSSIGVATEPTKETAEPNDKTMNASAVSLGYVMLYVNDVAASLAFYENAFGLRRRFFNDENGKAYGELETGAVRLAFANFALVDEHVKRGVMAAAPDKPPAGSEISLVTSDVPALFARSVKAGAAVVAEPETKPWGQTVAYVKDNAGHLVGLCTPLP